MITNNQLSGELKATLTFLISSFKEYENQLIDFINSADITQESYYEHLYIDLVFKHAIPSIISDKPHRLHLHIILADGDSIGFLAILENGILEGFEIFSYHLKELNLQEICKGIIAWKCIDFENGEEIEWILDDDTNVLTRVKN